MNFIIRFYTHSTCAYTYLAAAIHYYTTPTWYVGRAQRTCTRYGNDDNNCFFFTNLCVYMRLFFIPSRKNVSEKRRPKNVINDDGKPRCLHRRSYIASTGFISSRHNTCPNRPIRCRRWFSYTRLGLLHRPDGQSTRSATKKFSRVFRYVHGPGATITRFVELNHTIIRYEKFIHERRFERFDESLFPSCPHP